LKKNLITIIFIIILFFTGLSTGLSGKSVYKIIYVDDDNTNGPWDGTSEHPYRYIEDAIDNATDGDTIRVYSGVYENPNNNVYIIKSLSIIGNGSSVTIINRPVYIEADNVLFQGFTINGFDYKTMEQVCCINLNNLDYCSINNNTISTDLSGIQIYDSNFNKIENNIFKKSGSFKPVFYLFSSNSNIIRGNYVYANYYGIYLDHCNNNIIDYNNCESSTISSYCIYFLSSINNTIISNNFTNCVNPIGLKSSDYNKIKNNMMKDSGSAMHIFSSNNTVISGNNMIEMNHGIILEYSCNNTINENIYTESEWSGITLYYESNNNIVSQNFIINNIFAGILLGHSVNNIIEFNDLIKNTGGGIYINPEANDNIIRLNNISYNGNKTDPTSAGITFDDKSDGNQIYNNNIMNNIEGLLLCGNKNIIRNNNFIGNEIHATFRDSWLNSWYLNYWDNLIGFGPKLIFGCFGKFERIPWVNFDWHPARKPYDIPIGV